ncbi:MAG: thioester domain-containing protein [Clostridia bacterium]|nr:thioester domain-containing protein [Clostridia bacterium]
MCRKLLAMLLCLLVIGSTASAGTIDLSTYRFQYGGVDIPGYAYDQPYLYPSPFTNVLRVDENLDGVINPATETIGSVYHAVLNLVDLNLVEEGGEGLYASVPTYCFDFNVPVRKGRTYTLAELATFSQDTEKNNRLRAIVTHSFPKVSNMATLQESVNVWLQKTDGPGYTPVRNLTAAEVITATQTAVWSVTNLLEVVDYLEGTTGFFTPDRSVFFNGYGNQSIGEYTEQNIMQVYRYLRSLPPEKPVPIKEYGFQSAQAVLKPQEDDTYTATITVQFQDDVDDKVAAMLQASCGEKQSNPVALTAGRNKYTLTIPGITTRTPEIAVSLIGMQIVEDVFLFEPDGGRSSAQLMGGLTSVQYNIDNVVRSIPVSMEPVVPATGDGAPVVLLTAMALLSLVGAMILRRKSA